MAPFTFDFEFGPFFAAEASLVFESGPLFASTDPESGPILATGALIRQATSGASFTTETLNRQIVSAR